MDDQELISFVEVIFLKGLLNAHQLQQIHKLFLTIALREQYFRLGNGGVS